MQAAALSSGTEGTLLKACEMGQSALWKESTAHTIAGHAMVVQRMQAIFWVDAY